MDTWMQELEQAKVIPVVKISSADKAPGLAKALLQGGMKIIEVTFRTDAAAEAIRAIVREVPEMLVCAGTVLTVEQAKEAIAAGACAIISPGTNPEVVAYCQEQQVPVIPGCATPTEVEACMRMGLGLVKLFPAEVVGGVSMLKALVGPYAQMRFMPTGGISLQNLASYLALSNVTACGGSWIAPESLIEEEKFSEITERAQQCRALVFEKYN